ncbi:hypothetical protein [Rhizobium halophilum]|uniref:hypothetical protein n=1 Tax=Rhizobium halophilum TaxID=2846852 RepID=UPI001EFC79FE|nr:hypothetical protein [Rhizobium halophilum]MCF6371278.1 hypothetical protein [Rhizobium halophilum]
MAGRMLGSIVDLVKLPDALARSDPMCIRLCMTLATDVFANMVIDHGRLRQPNRHCFAT